MRWPFQGNNWLKWNTIFAGFDSSAKFNMALVAQFARERAAIFTLCIYPCNGLEMFRVVSTKVHWLNFPFGLVEPPSTHSAMLLQFTHMIFQWTSVYFWFNLMVCFVLRKNVRRLSHDFSLNILLNNILTSSAWFEKLPARCNKAERWLSSNDIHYSWLVELVKWPAVGFWYRS